MIRNFRANKRRAGGAAPPARPRGMSLAEALVTLLLVSIVFGIVATLAREYASLLKVSSARERALAACNEALDKVAGEVEGAVAVLTPDPEQTGDYVEELVFRRVDPSADGRLPATPLPPTSSVVWKPYDERYLLEVRYSHSGGTLVREATNLGTEQTWRQTVTGGLTGFSARGLGDGGLELRASYADGSSFRSLSTLVESRVGR